MSEHSTFRTGGPADLWIRPEGDTFSEYSGALIQAARNENIPAFVLGGGANIVVADEGLRGLVLDTGGWAGPEASVIIARDVPGNAVFFRSGMRVEDAVEYAASRGLSGLEFLAGMPGSIGGALWMNARCYGKSVSDVLIGAEILNLSGEKPLRQFVPYRETDYSYKKSSFQTMDALVLGGRFAMTERPEAEIRREMEEHRRDREKKGHYRYPSAGSVFKNNREFGAPTGKIIDDLGLNGLTLGDAQVAPWHGNIIINRGNARAADIKALTELVKEKVRAARGLELECEILFVGFCSP
ncbi:UDP-N-acetylenolpyruvoylglucosamine reductase [Spirochaetia bacterium]|nr:UDP-N-acetylenolpyruvoylglucosamine reductase [Spirochaetia bacterium]